MADPGPDLVEELRQLAGGLRRHVEQLDRMGLFGTPPAEQSPEGEGAADRPGAEDRGSPGHGVATAEPGSPASATATAARIAPEQPASADPSSRVSLATVREDLGECTRCKLSGSRKNIVFGVGAPRAPLMFIGEAPGAEEDRRGEPFVGAAGQLLDRMIAAMGWTRDTVYIANTLKCRPPGNRDPQPDELAECLPFLWRQIQSIGPRVIVTLGRPAAQSLLQTRAPISALRGRFRDLDGVRVMPTFHPAFLLRSPERKRDAWSDLKQVIDELARLGIASPNPPRTS